MVDTREQLVIDVSLGDEVTKVIPGIKAAIQGMAKDATAALEVPGAALGASLRKSLGGADVLEGLKRQFAETASEAASLASRLKQTKVDLIDSEATQRLNDYVATIRLEGEALKLSTQEREQYLAIMRAATAVDKLGLELSAEQVEAIRTAVAERQQIQQAIAVETEITAQAQRQNADTVADELAGRAEVMRSLREAIQLRSREEESIRKGFEASQAARAQELNRGFVRETDGSRAQELAELREAILARAAEQDSLRKNRTSLSEYLRGIRDERTLLQLDTREREVVIAQRRAEDLAIKAGIADRQRLLQLVRQEVQETQRVRGAALGGGGGIPSLSGVTGLLGTGGGQLGSVVSQAQQGASAMQQLAGATGLSTSALLALGATGAGIALVSTEIYAAARASYELSKGLAPIAALSADGAARLDELKGTVRELAAEAVKSHDEIVALALLAAEENLQGNADLLRAAAEASNAGLGTSSQALKSVKDILSAFDLPKTAENFRVVADSIVGVSSALGVNRQELASATAQAGRLAGQYGVSFQGIEALIGKVANRTGDFGSAASAVGTVIRRLSDQNDDLHKTFELIGVDLSDGAFRGDRFVHTIGAIGEAIERDSTLRQRILQGDRNAASILLLLTSRTDDLRAAMSAATQSSGQAAEAESRFLATSTSRWDAAFKRVAGLRDAIFELLTADLQAAQVVVPDVVLGGSVTLPEDFVRRAKENPTIAVGLDPKTTESLKQEVAEATKQAVDEGQRVANQFAPVLHFKVTDDAIQRSVRDALDRAERPTVLLDVQTTPQQVQDALKFLREKNLPADKPLDADTKAEVEAATRVVQQYFGTLDKADQVSRKLALDTKAGIEREIEQRSQAVEAVRIQIDELERQGVAVGSLRRALQSFRSEQDDIANAKIRQQRASAEADRLAVVAEMTKKEADLARAVGDVARADDLDRQAIEARATATRSALEAQRLASIEGARGSLILLPALLAINAERQRGVDLEEQIAQETRRQAIGNRRIEERQALLGLQGQLLRGLDGELFRIRSTADTERQRILLKQQLTAQDVQRLILIGQIEAKESGAARQNARLEVEQTLLGLQQDVARTYQDQVSVLGRISAAEEARLVQAFRDNGASEDKIVLLRELLALKEKEAIVDLRLSESQRSAVEEARRSLGDRLSGRDAFDTGFRAGIEDMRRLFADDFTQGVKLAQDALRTFRDSGVQNLEEVLDRSKSLADGLEAIGADFLRSIRRNLLEGLFNQLGGGLAGLFGGGGIPGLSGIGARAQGGLEHGHLQPVYQAAQGFVAHSRTRLDVAEVPGLQELIAPLVRGKLPVHVDERGGMQVRVRGAQVPVELEGSGARRRRADAAIFTGGARERSSVDTRAAASTERSGGSHVSIAPGAVVVNSAPVSIQVVSKDPGRAGSDVASMMPTITKAIAADIERGTTRALRDAIRAAAR